MWSERSCATQVTLVDESRAWFKAKVGFETSVRTGASGAPLSRTFCSAIARVAYAYACSMRTVPAGTGCSRGRCASGGVVPHSTCAQELPRAGGLCHHLVSSDEDMLVVYDIESDDRCGGRPHGLTRVQPTECDASAARRFVAYPPQFSELGVPVRFYAGVPIRVNGHRVGAVCVLDKRPKELSEDQKYTLRVCAEQVCRLCGRAHTHTGARC